MLHNSDLKPACTLDTTTRIKLTDAEYNAVAKLTHRTHLDEVFDIQYNDITDYWVDFDDNRLADLATGFRWLAEGIAYPLAHEGMEPEESALIVSLLKEFAGISDKEAEYLLKIEE